MWPSIGESGDCYTRKNSWASTQDREHRHSISPFGDVDEGVDLSLFDGYDDSLVPSDVVDDDQL